MNKVETDLTVCLQQGGSCCTDETNQKENTMYSVRKGHNGFQVIIKHEEGYSVVEALASANRAQERANSLNRKERIAKWVGEK